SSCLRFAPAALVWLAVTPAMAAQSGCDNALHYGMNPSFQTWTSRAIVFADAFQRARELDLWQSGPLGPAPLIPPGSGLISAGWPDPAQLPSGQRFGAQLFGSMGGTLPDGRTLPWVVTWKGRGSARLEGPNVLGEQNRGQQRVEVLVDPTRASDAALSITW